MGWDTAHWTANTHYPLPPNTHYPLAVVCAMSHPLVPPTVWAVRPHTIIISYTFARAGQVGTGINGGVFSPRFTPSISGISASCTIVRLLIFSFFFAFPLALAPFSSSCIYFYIQGNSRTTVLRTDQSLTYIHKYSARYSKLGALCPLMT